MIKTSAHERESSRWATVLAAVLIAEVLALWTATCLGLRRRRLEHAARRRSPARVVRQATGPVNWTVRRVGPAAEMIFRRVWRPRTASLRRLEPPS